MCSKQGTTRAFFDIPKKDLFTFSLVALCRISYERWYKYDQTISAFSLFKSFYKFLGSLLAKQHILMLDCNRNLLYHLLYLSTIHLLKQSNCNYHNHNM